MAPRLLFALLVAIGLGASAAEHTAEELPASDAQQIAKEAYIYGVPLIESYRALVAEGLDSANPRFQAPLNTLTSEARIYAPGDRGVKTPNPDIARSTAWLDLRTQPVVLSVPAIETDRYYSIQLVDLYGFNFRYIGTRTTGNAAGRYLIVGPRWRGEKLEGVSALIRAETDFVRAIYRTQIFDADDLDRVREIQGEYRVQSLGEVLGWPPIDKPQISPRPIGSTRGLDFLAALDLVLQFCPAVPDESIWRARLAKIGPVSGKGFDSGAWSAELRAAVNAGLDEGRAAVEAETSANRPPDLYGDRAFFGADTLKRAAGALLGLHGVSPEESLERLYVTDSEGKPLDGAASQYVLNLSGTNMPPTEAFWSLSLYDRSSEGLVANPIDRYRIDSLMLDAMKRDAGGGLSLFIQHASPGADWEANWLPAPDRPFYMVLRLYWPAPDAVSTWKAPLLFAEPPSQQPTPTSFAAGAAQEVEPLPVSEEVKPELERPTEWGEPTEVRVGVFVIDVDQVDSAEQSFAASVYYEARWNSPVLRHKGPGALHRNITEVWTPRLSIIGQQNAWEAFPEAVEIQPDGEVVYRQKLWGHFSQPLDLHDFPLDRQKLEIHIAALGLLEAHVKMVPLEREEGRKSGIARSFSVPDFDVVSWNAGPAPFTPFEGEVATAGFKLQIEIERQIGYYVLKVIIPLCLIVIMSWLPRWIDPEEIGPNIGISTTAFLTLVAYLFAITVLLPPVSYITRIDRFILLSTLMVFGSLVQTIVNSALVRKGSAGRLARSEHASRLVYPVVLGIVLVVSFVG